MGKFFFFFFLNPSLAIPQFGVLFHISSLRLPSGHSGPILTLSIKAQAFLFSPLVLVVDTRVWATSLLGVVVGPVSCVFY